MKKLEVNLLRRREIAATYTAAFREFPAVVTPSAREDVKPAWHLYPIRVETAKLNVDRGQLFRVLRSENIGVSVHYIPVYFHSYYRDQLGYKRGQCPVAERVYEQLISLPMFHGMSGQDVEDVLSVVRKVMNHYSRQLV